MSLLLLTVAITLVVALALTPAVRIVAQQCGAVDHPDGVRKLHKRAVPLWGGAAVYLALVFGVFAARYGAFGSGPLFDELAMRLVPGAGLVCLFGALDDYRRLAARTKLLLQIVAVLPMVFLGCCVDRVVVFGHPIDLGWWAVPLTVFWLVGCINALNLLDGMDGLASLVGLSTALMLGLIAVSEGYPHVSTMALILAGALAGFLVYNLPPATIFLGDSGSMVIGLVVGFLGIQGGLKTSTTLSVTAPAVVLALPMLDVVLAVIRRRLTGRRIAGADRQHIHHRLLDRGLNPWQVLCVLGAACLLTGAAATAATIFRNDALAWIVTLTLLVLAIRLRLFGDYEFSLLKAAMARGVRRIARQVLLSRPRTARSVQRSFPELWDRLLEEIEPWNVRQLELCVIRQGQVVSRHQWMNPAPTIAMALGWTLTLRFQQPGGPAFEVRVSVVELGPDRPYLTGLTRVLERFGKRLTALDHLPVLPFAPGGRVANSDRRHEAA